MTRREPEEDDPEEETDYPDDLERRRPRPVIAPRRGPSRYDRYGRYIPVRYRTVGGRRLTLRRAAWRPCPSRHPVWDQEAQRRNEEARLRQPWRCINGDGRPRAGTAKRFKNRSEYCAECLAKHKRELAAARQRRRRAVNRQKYGTESAP